LTRTIRHDPSDARWHPAEFQDAPDRPGYLSRVLHGCAAKSSNLHGEVSVPSAPQTSQRTESQNLGLQS
jgi:hypothetical protein